VGVRRVHGEPWTEAGAVTTAVKKWYPNAEQADWGPECRFDLHSICAGNVDLYVDGVRYIAQRCRCPCHPRGVRRSDWPHTT
jgi:hypothetical protein